MDDPNDEVEWDDTSEDDDTTEDQITAKDEPRENEFSPFKDGVIEITEHAEVPIVSREARVVEEISINKDVEEHDEEVRDSVRRNEVDDQKLNTAESDD